MRAHKKKDLSWPQRSTSYSWSSHEAILSYCNLLDDSSVPVQPPSAVTLRSRRRRVTTRSYSEPLGLDDSWVPSILSYRATLLQWTLCSRARSPTPCLVFSHTPSVISFSCLYLPPGSHSRCEGGSSSWDLPGLKLHTDRVDWSWMAHFTPPLSSLSGSFWGSLLLLIPPHIHPPTTVSMWRGCLLGRIRQQQQWKRFFLRRECGCGPGLRQRHNSQRERPPPASLWWRRWTIQGLSVTTRECQHFVNTAPFFRGCKIWEIQRDVRGAW